jgi:hypothetical protein
MAKQRDKHHHKDHDHKKHKKPKPKPKPTPNPVDNGPVTESLKAKSTQTGDQAMNATPSAYPAEPANAEAVYTTGPGQAVEYNYTRQGTYAEDYAQQQMQQVPVQGMTVTGVGAPGYTGQANNPT